MDIIKRITCISDTEKVVSIILGRVQAGSLTGEPGEAAEEFTATVSISAGLCALPGNPSCILAFTGHGHYSRGGCLSQTAFCWVFSWMWWRRWISTDHWVVLGLHRRIWSFCACLTLPFVETNMVSVDSGRCWRSMELPDFTMPIILSFLTRRELCKCSCVAKKWTAFVQHRKTQMKKKATRLREGVCWLGLGLPASIFSVAPFHWENGLQENASIENRFNLCTRAAHLIRWAYK